MQPGKTGRGKGRKKEKKKEKRKVEKRRGEDTFGYPEPSTK